MKSLIATLAILGAIAYFVAHGGNFDQSIPTEPKVLYEEPGTFEQCGRRSTPGQMVTITMLYSDEKQEWIEQAAHVFSRLCPSIRVQLVVMNDLASADAILKGKEKPTLWVPADNLVVQYLDHKWKQRSKEPLFDFDKRQSLVRSPMVWMTWSDRHQVLDSLRGSSQSTEGPWMETGCALVPREAPTDPLAQSNATPRRWIDWHELVTPPKPKNPWVKAKKEPPVDPTLPTPEQITRWGKIKFAHPSPSRSGVGIGALYLLAYDYLLPPAERASIHTSSREEAGAPDASTPAWQLPSEEEVGLRRAFDKALEERKDALRNFLRRCEGSENDFAVSARGLTYDMFHLGAERHDIIVTHEHLALSVLQYIDARAGDMKEIHVLYPEPTIWAEHPALFLFPTESGHEEEREAAEKWIAFLKSDGMQQKAIKHGFRPAANDDLIHDFDDVNNPFLHLRRYGARVRLDRSPPPRLDGKIVNELIELWGEATGTF